MKKLLLILLCLPMIGFGQSVPQGINYQAVARDTNGDLLMNQQIHVQFSIIPNITTGVVSWQEYHQGITTNEYGLFTAIIGGTGQVPLDSINWGDSHHFLKVEIDLLDGNGLIDMGTTAFMSVPYALQAGNGLPSGMTDQTLYYNGTDWVATSNLSNNGTNEVTINGSLNIDKSSFGDILRLKSTNFLSSELSLGTSTGFSYINSGVTTIWPGGTPLALQAGGTNIAVCYPTTNAAYPNAFDLASEKLLIDGVAGVPGQVLTALDSGKVKWESVDSLLSSDLCVIPYEPYNASILLTELLWETAHVYWTSFIAPSTGYYSTAKLLVSSANLAVNSVYTGKIGVGIYNNLSIPATAIAGSGSRPTRNIPDMIMGESYYNVPFPASEDLRNVYLDFSFDNPIPLVADQIYWFAIGVTNQLYFNFHADYFVHSCNVVESNGTPFQSDYLPSSVGGAGALRASERATWFRISK